MACDLKRRAGACWYCGQRKRSAAATLGLMFDTSIALTRIILAGMLDEFPS